LCVTDGYRPLAEQIAVKLATPRLAATPGTSQHGLGLAVDLCGGVQSFAAPAHLWMQQNAPLYGWFHPAWAEPTGTMPEPWHWEFAS
jgi:LAS superfamily LD-carboxypeptidase LdcB